MNSPVQIIIGSANEKSASERSPSSKAPSTHPPEILVNGVSITEDAIAREMQYHPANTQQAAFHAAAQALVIKEVLLQNAHQKLAHMAEVRTLDPEQLMDKFIQQEVQVPTPSAQECRHYYQHNTHRFRTSDLMEVSHILLAADPNDMAQVDEAKTRAYALLDILKKAPLSFANLAKSHSDCPSKEVKGSLGQISRGQTVPEFEKALAKLPEGLAQHPIETRYGFHVVWIERKVQGRQLEFEMVQDKIQHYLNAQVQRRALSQFISLLLGQADIVGLDLKTPSDPLVQ